MNTISLISLYGLLFGLLGTTLGGIIGIIINPKSKNYLNYILSFTSGLMLSIICFELVPESILNAHILYTIIGLLVGIIFMYIINLITNKEFNFLSPLLRTSFIIFIGLTLHNLPEGISIGAGFIQSQTLGISLGLAILLHDIPEGILVASPMRASGLSKIKALFLTIISGLSTGVGAFLGANISQINEKFISLSLSFAAGAMLYIVAFELLTSSFKKKENTITSTIFMIGILLGIFFLL